MKEIKKLDHPIISKLLFHPRRDSDQEKENPKNLLIKVTDSINVGCRLHLNNLKNPNLIYFHGNAELVSEYDEFAKIYNKFGINFIPVDYRGYGFSDGQPSFSTMISDSVKIFEDIYDRLVFKGYAGPFFIMGRSLGSASVLEISNHFEKYINGMIIESGFAHIRPLFKLFGVNPDQLKINPEKALNHIDKIKKYSGPILIIHAKNDQIIHFNEGKELYDNSQSKIKFCRWIENAHHNNIIQQLGINYFKTIHDFIFDKIE